MVKQSTESLFSLTTSTKSNETQKTFPLQCINIMALFTNCFSMRIIIRLLGMCRWGSDWLKGRICDEKASDSRQE